MFLYIFEESRLPDSEMFISDTCTIGIFVCCYVTLVTLLQRTQILFPSTKTINHAKKLVNKISLHLKTHNEFSLTLAINFPIQISSTFDIGRHEDGRLVAIEVARHLSLIDLYVLFVTEPIYLNSCQSLGQPTD